MKEDIFFYQSLLNESLTLLKKSDLLSIFVINTVILPKNLFQEVNLEIFHNLVDYGDAV